MENLLITLYHWVQSSPFLLCSIIISFGGKIYFLTSLTPKGLSSGRIHKPWIFLIGTLIGSLFGDIAWVIKLMREMMWADSSYAIVTFFIRISWGFLILQYQALALFLPSLTQKKFQLSYLQKILIVISSLFVLYFFYLAIFDNSLVGEFERKLAKLVDDLPLEMKIMRFVPFYLFSLIITTGLLPSFRQMRGTNLPKILKKQLKILIMGLICPYLFVEFLQAASIVFSSMGPYLYPVVSISTLLLSYTIYYCLKKVMHLRFLNFHSHVHSPPKVNFIGQFKHVLAQLSQAMSIYELGHITQTFFKETFNIPLHTTNLYLCEQNTAAADLPETSKSKEEIIHSTVEQFISPHNTEFARFIAESKIIIYDDITFEHFYEETFESKHIIAFLDAIDADVFLPIYKQQKMIAYIIVKRNARWQECYNKEEKNGMLVFANYLSNIINLIQNRNIDSLIQQEKRLKEQVYYTHQEINQFKESIRSFLRNTNQKTIGVIFYKNRTFTFGNQAAKELVNIDLNHQEGHPLAKAVKDIAHKVTEYKSHQTTICSNDDGQRLVLSGVPHLEQNCVLITVAYPDISDIISTHVNQLHNPTDWDYLLYLETTKAGRLINQLMPAESEQFLNIKINILKAALSKSALLLIAPEDDIKSIVKVLHHLSLRETLHVIDLQTKEVNFTIAAQLLGLNRTLGIKSSQHHPLLEKLSDTGTLFINNAYLLDVETQNYLTEFIKSGYFRVFKSDHKIQSNARLICSIPPNIQRLLQEDILSKPFYNTLASNALIIPPLSELPQQELVCLADRITDQVIQANVFKNLLVLTEKDKQILLQKCPDSLSEFKQKIHQLLAKKSKQNNIYDEAHFGTAHTITDPDLAQAARLGKQALKNQKTMTMLWHTFKNQNKIASFLGVNRSSVNRRCKEYNLV